ncbi:MAG: hypothetical protein H0U60_10120 [Blastocatellia bacterium]|nr:hypothetical protein [Blastocatellia bacterium]
MTTYLDVTTWSRRDLFEFFRNFDNPYFNICTRLDVTNLLLFLRSRPDLNVSLAYHYFALRVANEIEPFRYRLRDGRVVIHEVINGGTTVLTPNESFTFAYFDFDEDFERFMLGAQHSISDAKASNSFEPTANDDTIYFTTLPWVSFTSFAHARNWGREDSVPRIAFGKFVQENERTFLPFSIEVHHALMDGLHVGRYINRLQESLDQPEDFLNARQT